MTKAGQLCRTLHANERAMRVASFLFYISFFRFALQSVAKQGFFDYARGRSCSAATETGPAFMSSAHAEAARFTTFTPWNHQPGLWIVTILSIIYSFLALLVRHVILRKTFTRADAVLAISYVRTFDPYRSDRY